MENGGVKSNKITNFLTYLCIILYFVLLWSMDSIRDISTNPDTSYQKANLEVISSLPFAL